MQAPRVLGTAMLLITVALVGCLGGDDPSPIRGVEASGGLASDGYAYDGQGLTEAGAQISGYIDGEEDRGSLNVTFEFAGSTWQVSQQSFSGAEEFKDGGVVFDLVYHGDTGVSSGIIPTIDGEIVTYGTATVLRDGQPAPYPGGTEGAWDAHLMLSRDTVRGADGLITKADGTTPYDPSTPSDARIIEDDPQALLQLTAPSGPESARAPLQVNETVSVQGPGFSDTVEIGGEPYASVVVNVTASGGESPIGAGDIRVSLVNETGAMVATDSGQVLPNQAFTSTLSLDQVAGPVTLEIRGNGTYSVDVGGTVTYDDHPFIILTWADYTADELDAAPG